MNKMLKGFSAGLLIVVAVLVPACRSSKKKVQPPTTTTQAAVPEVPVTPPETKVDTQPPDFVQEKPAVEPLPTNIDALNQTVQSRGLIRDAFFSYDESTLSNDAQSALTTSANWLKQNPSYNVLVEGHCDERGTEQYNLALADRRAAIARDYLVTLGVDPGRIRTVSYGEERPFAAGHDESSWSQNRRAHLVLTSPGQ
jgi:peptidoglycan-associated lipoprotein